MGLRRLAAALSIALVVLSAVSLGVRQLNLGLDFTGGALVELRYSEPVDLAAVRTQLADAGFADARVQYFGTEQDLLIRMAEQFQPSLGDQVAEVLQANAEGLVQLQRSEYVGAQVGEELREQGGLALLLALVVVMGYIAFRFQYKFAFGAVAALVHDVVVTLGVFSLFQLEFDLTVLAALLALIGYSLNDTIVVSDRIRENFRKVRKGSPAEVINLSLNQTIERTLITSLTTLLVLLALFFFGGETIHHFALALIIGVVVGTYSSIYVASNLLLTMGIAREDLLVPVKEGAELDDRP
ncbi:MAG: protein translocase subunit SecF [Pseudomonadota bacterium]|nr:protein translocase subunit SecF [Pseudomonadota bacterium]